MTGKLLFSTTIRDMTYMKEQGYLSDKGLAYLREMEDELNEAITTCKICHNKIDEEEFDNNDGLCDDCAFDQEGEEQ